jgi:hypothetical protein
MNIFGVHIIGVSIFIFRFNGARGLQVTYLTFSTHYYFPLNARTTRNAFLMMYILLYRSLLLDLGCGLTLVLVLSLVFIFAEYLLICQPLTPVGA